MSDDVYLVESTWPEQALVGLWSCVGTVRSWLLHGLAQQRAAINSHYRDSDRLTEDWARHRVWEWLALHVWGVKHQLLLTVQVGCDIVHC